MRVLLIGHLKSLVNKDSIDIKLDADAILGEVLRMLPEELEKGLLSGDGIRPGYLVLLNGSDVRSLGEGLRTRVSDGDTLTIIPIIHGG